MSNIIKHENIKKSNKKKFIVFLFGGLSNTVITYVLYYLFINFFSYKISYTSAYLIGILYSYLFNSIIVFKSTISLFKFLKYPSIYIIQYLLSITIIYVSIEFFYINKNYAPIISIILLIPVSFMLNKLYLNKK